MDFFSLTHDELVETLETRYGKGPYFAKALIREIFKNGNNDYHHSPVFSQSGKFAALLKKDLIIPVPEISRIIKESRTVKYMCRFNDGLESESVIIPMQNHNTLCISSQIGCKMSCRFCETGHMGFIRDLTVSEIIAQVYAARFVLRKPIKNIVFMGMGEPFDNFTHVGKAIKILNDQRGFDFSHRHITISTAGVIPGIENLARLSWNIHLAVSLNAPNDLVRSSLMPINSRYPMNDLRNAIMNFPLKNRGVILIEYVIIKGINDGKRHAEELSAYLLPLKKHIRLNLIPLNVTSESRFQTTTDEDVHRFASYLDDHDLFIIKRWSKGSSFGAGCGQLGKT